MSHWHHQDQYACPRSGLSGEAWHNRSAGFLREGGWDLQTLVKTSASLFSRKAFELRVSPFPPLTLCAQHSPPGFILHQCPTQMALPSFLPSCQDLPITCCRPSLLPHKKLLFLQGQPFFTEETLLVGKMGTVIPPGLKPHFSGAICFFRRRRRFI